MPHVPPLCGKLVHGAARHSQDTAIGPNGISPEGHPHRARLVQKDEFYFSSPFFILTTDSEVSRQGAFSGVFIFRFGACFAHLAHLAFSWIWGTSQIPSINMGGGLEHLNKILKIRTKVRIYTYKIRIDMYLIRILGSRNGTLKTHVTTSPPGHWTPLEGGGARGF